MRSRRTKDLSNTVRILFSYQPERSAAKPKIHRFKGHDVAFFCHPEPVEGPRIHAVDCASTQDPAGMRSAIRCRGACVKRLSIGFGAWHKHRYIRTRNGYKDAANFSRISANGDQSLK
jgi:hypothetical protein